MEPTIENLNTLSPLEISSAFINKWLEETSGFPVTLQIAKLATNLATLIRSIQANDPSVYLFSDEVDGE